MFKPSPLDVALLFRGAPFQTPSGPAKLVGWADSEGEEIIPQEYLSFYNPEWQHNGLDADGKFSFFLSCDGWKSYDPAQVKPILHPFADLVKPLPDGTVPALEILEMADACIGADAIAEYVDWRDVPDTQPHIQVRWGDGGGGRQAFIWQDGSLTLPGYLTPSDPALIAAYLRRLHFNDGSLSADQYVTADV